MSIEAASIHHDRGGDTGPYYTVAEAARKLKVSHSTVWRWIDAGKLPAYRVGPKAIRIAERDLDAVIAPATTATRVATETPAAKPAGAEVDAHPVPGRVLTGPRTTALTDDEVKRRLAALERATAFRGAQLANRAGIPFSSSTELIRQTREELSDRA